MKWNFRLWSIFLILTSCSVSPVDRISTSEFSTVGTVRWNELSDLYFNRFVDSVVYLPLEPHPAGLFRVVDKAIIKDGKIFIFDYHARNQVLVFDTTGKFLYPIGQRGKGPGEYTQMRNFTVDDQYVYIIDNQTHRLLLYNLDDGRFVVHRPLPFWATDMACFETGDFLFSQDRTPVGVTDPDRQSRILVTDKQLKIKKRFFSFTDEDCPVEHLTSFRQGAEISFHTLVVDTVVLFSATASDSLPCLFAFDFGSQAIPTRDRSRWDACQNYTYLTNPPVVTPSYIVGETQEREETYSYLYHRASGKTYKGYDAANDFISVLCSDEAGNLYMDFQVSEVYHYMIEHGWPRASADIERRIEDGDYVLIKLIMR